MTPLHLPTLVLISVMTINWLGLPMVVLRDRMSGNAFGLGAHRAYLPWAFGPGAEERLGRAGEAARDRRD